MLTPLRAVEAGLTDERVLATVVAVDLRPVEDEALRAEVALVRVEDETPAGLRRAADARVCPAFEAAALELRRLAGDAFR